MNSEDPSFRATFTDSGMISISNTSPGAAAAICLWILSTALGPSEGGKDKEWYRTREPFASPSPGLMFDDM